MNTASLVLRAARRALGRLACGLPRRLAARATLDELRDDLTPERGESWRGKLRRSARAVRNAFVPGRTTSAAAS